MAVLDAQVRQQAYTLAISDGFLTIVFVCIGIIAMIALMKHTKIYFDSLK